VRDRCARRWQTARQGERREVDIIAGGRPFATGPAPIRRCHDLGPGKSA
jgi:hypothetical protein